jgi:hypothetical protein
VVLHILQNPCRTERCIGELGPGRLAGEVAVAEGADQLTTKRTWFGMPRSWLGWVSVALALLGVLEIFVRRPFGFRGVFATFIVAGAGALGAVLWKKERSILIWIPLVIGALAALWVGAEVLFPH